MAVCEDDKECGVCYQTYTRWVRVPRLLHCGHAFCTSCLKQICQSISTLLAIRCPFCRWTTCVGPNLSLQEGLWIHTKLWDQISEYENEDMDEEEEEEMRRAKPAKQTQLTQESIRPTLQCVRPQVKVNPFLKRISSGLQRRFRPSHQICPGQVDSRKEALILCQRPGDILKGPLQDPIDGILQNDR